MGGERVGELEAAGREERDERQRSREHEGMTCREQGTGLASEGDRSQYPEKHRGYGDGTHGEGEESRGPHMRGT